MMKNRAAAVPMMTSTGGGDVFDDLSIESKEELVHKIFVFQDMPSTANDRLPASLRDELRRAASLKAMDILFKKTSMKVCEQRDLLHDIFHGNPSKNIISSTHQLCNAEGIFSALFEDRTGGTVEACPVLVLVDLR